MYKITIADDTNIELEFDTSLTLTYHTVDAKFIINGGDEKSIRYTINFPDIQSSIKSLISDAMEVIVITPATIPKYHDAISTFIQLIYNLYNRKYISTQKRTVFNILNTYSVVLSRTDDVKIYYRNLSNPDILSKEHINTICSEIKTYIVDHDKLVNSNVYDIINGIVNAFV